MQKLKITLIAIFCFTTSYTSFAQQELSLTMGMNRSNVEWTNLNEHGWPYRTGYFFGIRNVYLKRKKYELSSELQYSVKGSGYRDFDYIEKEVYKYLDGIHIFTYKPISQFGVFTGINTGFLLTNVNKVIIDRVFDPGILLGFSGGFKNIKLFILTNQSLFNNEFTTPGLKDLGIRVLNKNVQLGLRFSFYNKEKTNNKKFEK